VFALKDFKHQQKLADVRNKVPCGLVAMTVKTKTLQVSLQWLWSVQEKQSLPLVEHWLCNTLKYFSATVAYAMKQASSFFDCCNAFNNFIVRDSSSLKLNKFW